MNYISLEILKGSKTEFIFETFQEYGQSCSYVFNNYDKNIITISMLSNYEYSGDLVILLQDGNLTVPKDVLFFETFYNVIGIIFMFNEKC